jgi:hypothetical protein
VLGVVKNTLREMEIAKHLHSNPVAVATVGYLHSDPVAVAILAHN